MENNRQKLRFINADSKIARKTIASATAVVLAFSLVLPITAIAEPTDNTNSNTTENTTSNENTSDNTSNENTAENTNTALDTDTPPENVTYDDDAEKQPYEPNTTTSTSSASEEQILRTITAQMVRNSGLSEEELDALMAEIESREDELKQINAEINNLRDSLATRQREVDSITSLISSKEKEITELNDKIKTTEENIEANKKILGYYVAESYKFENNALEEICNVLFGGTSFTDVMKQIDFWTSLQDEQANIMSMLASEEKELQLARADVSAASSILEQSKTDLVSANSTLGEASTSYAEKLASVQTDINLLKGQQVMEQEGYLQQIYSSLLVTPADMTETEARLRSEIVKSALSTLGTMYVWGGESWEEGGFDCSGVCYYAYAQNGIILPRVAVDQYNGAPKIAASDLRPGDLVFQGSTASDIYHVMMYIGDGLTIEAPNFGEVVQIRPLAGRQVYGFSSPLAAYSFQ